MPKFSLNNFNPLRVKHWTIGLWEGDSLENLKEKKNNPVLSKDDIEDCNAGFIADPFLFKNENTYYLFFEILNIDSAKGEIGCAHSDDLQNWTYDGIILKENFHLSYPYIFRHEDEIYFVPESYQDKSIRLYKAKNFPLEWEYCGNLIEGENFTDNTIFQKDGKFWMFTYILDIAKEADNSRLEIWYSDSLQGKWEPHQSNPISFGKDIPSRPGGRISCHGEIELCAQNTANFYGQEIYRYKIIKLNENEFEHRLVEEKPFLTGTGTGWNSLGVHNFDMIENGDNQILACSDGLSYVKLKNPKIIFLKLRNKLAALFK